MVAEHHSKPEAAIHKRYYSTGQLMVMLSCEKASFHAASFTLATYLQLIAICQWSDAEL
jgi:hypothetical protein